MKSLMQIIDIYSRTCLDIYSFFEASRSVVKFSVSEDLVSLEEYVYSRVDYHEMLDMFKIYITGDEVVIKEVY